MEKKPLFFIFILFFCVTPFLTAQNFLSDFNDYFYWSFSGGLALLAADNGTNADPPQIIPTLGASAAYSIFKHFRIELTEDIYFTNYEYNWGPPAYPMASSPENRTALVIGFITGLQTTGFFPITENGTSFRVFTGITVDLRIVTSPVVSDVHITEEMLMQADAINDYFWTNGRMLFIPMGVGMDFPISNKSLLGFDLRAWAPLYRLWTNEDIPAIDGWRFGVNLRISPNKGLPPPRPTRASRQPKPKQSNEEETAKEETTEET